MRVLWLEQSACDLPADDDWLSNAEQLRMRGFFIPKRKADWRLGRWTAKLAVASYLNLSHHRNSLADIEVRPNDFGVPRAFIVDEPALVSISISHRAARGVCAVAPFGTHLGCDLELVEARSEAFLADYFTAEEMQLFAKAPPADRDRIANLLWSAKESALKALGMGLRVDCRTIIVASIAGLSDEEERQSEQPDWHSLRILHSGDQTFHGWWQQTGTLLSTMVASPAPRQPEVVSHRVCETSSPGFIYS